MDVARAAGISKGAASLALNGRSGVSESTRSRVAAIADTLGWTPNGTARALSGARAGAIGWAILRTAKSATIDPYFTELFTGIELELAGTDTALVVKLVSDRHEEADLYRRWAAERRVDGVLLTDLEVDDGRFGLLDRLGLPLAAFRSSENGLGYSSKPAVWLDETLAVSAALDPLRDLGHRRIAWISGDRDKAAVQTRAHAVANWGSGTRTDVTTHFSDYSPQAGVEITLCLLEGAEPPTAVVLDNDLMALAAVSACARAGIDVPGSVSMVSFIDGPTCAIAQPTIAALQHPIATFGRMLTRRLLDADDASDDTLLPLPEFVARDSLAAPRDAV